MTARLRSVGTAALLALLFGAFAFANLSQWHKTGRPSGLGAMILAGVIALLFIFRRPAVATSGRLVAWVAAPVGTFTILLARPVATSHAGVTPVFEAMQLGGLILALAGIGVLGRSFGLVAANRGVKTTGLYGLVRHPLYSAYLLVDGGYVLENLSVRNVTLVLMALSAQMVRIREEERVLVEDRSYRDYCRRVRYRLVPLVY
jgi:protein-S-isoprenylcysteine O-methyltransferase Ste14